MNVRIHSQGFDLTPAIAARINRRLDGVQSRFADDLIGIDVYLKDLNGPKGGFDKQVIIRAQIRHRAPLSISATEADLYVAIDGCVRRCTRAIGRTISRQRLVRRRGMQQLAAAAGDL